MDIDERKRNKDYNPYKNYDYNSDFFELKACDMTLPS
jgi:hypothetical protein